MSKEEILTCDIKFCGNQNAVHTVKVPVMFDHDQDDGKSKTRPYFEMKQIDMCQQCFDIMVDTRQLIYAYGVMGFNDYYLKELTPPTNQNKSKQ